ncbi:MAG: hypothetical protein ACKOCX_03955 [Planctomycetota bacterium]
MRVRWLAGLALLATTIDATAADGSPSPLWLVDGPVAADTHAAFRGTFDLPAGGEVEFRLLGASWFVAWLDGEYFAEGPARFKPEFPEYQTFRRRLEPGRHVLAVQVHHVGADTRMLRTLDPFLWCEIVSQGKPVETRWKSSGIGGYTPRFRRINPQLGWIEWLDTRLVPIWQAPDYDDAPWQAPVGVERTLGRPTPVGIANPQAIEHTVTAVADGHCAETFGYETCNPAARFFLRDLAPRDVPPQGVWRRYDLGRVRLMRPQFVLDLPAGAVVEFAASEALAEGRVSPWITLSAGDSCNLDHFVARGGRQEFFPLTPKGGRFLEVHVLAPPDQVSFVEEKVLERCYYGPPEGAFRCADELLNRIWAVGVETHRACAEDGLTDNPTRERGQWAGDVVTVGMEIAAAAFTDLRMCRRGLVQFAQSARADGLVAGMCPGQDIYLSTFAAQWVSACVRYWELAGDRALLEELFPAAERNLAAFEAKWSPEGIEDSLGWGFVDWGYVRNPGPSDMGVNLHYLAALRAMERWCRTLAKEDRADHYRRLAAAVAARLERSYAEEFDRGGDAWSRIGYHRAALGLRLGFFEGARKRECIAALKRHMLNCFPNNPDAPRLSDPAASNPQLITPYFAHFVMPLLIEHGELGFVLDQYRTCWGWALANGRTTWPEVFDLRWSQCHQWAGCPTWQLSRYVLGLQPRQDLGERHVELSFVDGPLEWAEGLVPLPGTDKPVAVRWERTPAGVRYRLETPIPIWLHLKSPTAGGADRVVPVEQVFEETL